MSLIFKNSFNQLPKQFYSKIEPEKTNKPKKVLNRIDKDIKIEWPKEQKDIILSEKDKYAPFIKEIKKDNLF